MTIRRTVAIAALMAALAPSMFALTEIDLNGIVWTYTISNGGAIVGGGDKFSTAVAPGVVCDNLAIPGELGGLPVVGIANCAFWSCSGLKGVSIPGSVINIGDYAFYRCSGLMSVGIPATVETIGREAFYECSSLSSIKIPAGVVSISDYAFDGCSSLPAIEIPNGVETIGDYAFSGCASATNAVIPDSVTAIGSYAFRNCEGLTSLVVPDSVLRIGRCVFGGCAGLKSLTVPFVGGTRGDSDSNANFGRMFESFSSNPTRDIDGYRTVFQNYASGYECNYIPTNLASVVVTDATQLGYAAFRGCCDLVSVTLNEGCTSIWANAFQNCSGLTKIGIPATVETIGSYAFDGCSALPTIEIPNGVETIGDYAFSGCVSATNAVIPGSVTTIGSYVFRNCAGLTSLFVPDNVLRIGEGAFGGCAGLKSLTIPFVGESRGGAGYQASFGRMFGHYSDTVEGSREIWQINERGESSYSGYCYIPTNLVSVVVTDATQLGYGAFDGCIDLVSVTLNEGCTGIGAYAFRNCSGLTKIGIPATVAAIGSYAFDGCSALPTIEIPNGVETIGDYAFSGCVSATNAVIPGSVTAIGAYALQNCVELASLFVPDSVLRIGVGVFGGCVGLKSLTIPFVGESRESAGSNANFGRMFESGISSDHSREGCRSVRQRYTFDSPNWVRYYCIPTNLASVVVTDATQLGYGAFMECIDLVSVTLNEGCTNLWDNAFDNCSGLADFEIPSTVAAIGSYAFSGCPKALSSIEIPDGVTSIGDYAFSGCVSATNAVIPGSVATIGSHAFQNCAGLTSLVVPASVQWIGVGAFGGCAGLESLTIPFVGETRESTGSPALFGRLFGNLYSTVTEGCREVKSHYNSNYTAWTYSAYIPTNLASVVVTDAIQLGYGAFDGCVDQVSVTLNEGCTCIGTYAFQNCTGLAEMNIPETVTWIDRYAFRGCSDGLFDLETCPGLKMLDGWVVGYTGMLPVILDLSETDLRGIAGAVFENCRTLGTVILPEGFVAICPYAFNGCTSLADVSLPSTLLRIGDVAFRNCRGLTNITCYAAIAPQCDDLVFGSISSTGTLHVPEGSAASYTNGVTAWIGTVNGWLPPWNGATGWRVIEYTSGDADGDATEATPVPVPYAWLDKYGLGDGTEASYEAAALAGAANGVNSVWECYVAGLDPTNANSVFTSFIGVTNGVPHIWWTPNLGDARVYTIQGKTNLLDDAEWAFPTNSAHRFFRVKVEMPGEGKR